MFPCESLSVNSLSFCLYCAWTEGLKDDDRPGETSSEKGGREVWHRQWENHVPIDFIRSNRCEATIAIGFTLRRTTHYPLSRVMLGIISRLNLESKTCFFPDLWCFSNLFHGLVLSFKASFFVFCKTTFFHRWFFSKATIFHRVLQAAMIPAAAAVIVVPRH